MAITNREIVELLAGRHARATARWVRQAMKETGPVTVELDDWFVDVDEPRTTVKIELDGVPDLRAEMPTEEFFRHIDDLAAR